MRNAKLGFCGVLSLAAAAVTEAAPIDIGSRLEVLWDDHIVDVSKTTAKRTVHRPAYDGECGVHCRIRMFSSTS